MNSNAYYGNQPGNANMYYGTGIGNNAHDQEAPMGYQHLNDNPNQYNAANPKTDGHYPTTGLTPEDIQPQETSTEFVLPNSVKMGLMCCSITCFFLFFVALLIK